MLKLPHSAKNGGVWKNILNQLRATPVLQNPPTKIIKTQTNHFVLSIVAYVKPEWLKLRTGNNHFAMKAKIYLAAQKAAYNQLKKISTLLAA